MIYGYARVSTEAQDLEPQVKALRKAGAKVIFEDVASGAKRDRKGLRKAVAALRPKDVLIVSRLDRLARSTRDLLNTLNEITERKAGFKSVADTWADTTTMHGRFVVTVLGGLAEFERELIVSRTTEGRKRAAARGVHIGRPSKLNAHQRREALARIDNGEAQADVARSFAVDRSTISRLRPRIDAARTRSLPADRLALQLAAVPTGRKLDSETERAARAFLARLDGKYVDALLYGSRARGTHLPGSDADLAVILKGKPGDRAAIGMDMAGIAVDVLDETGILVSALPLWAVELKRPERFSNPALIEAIRREGLRL